MLDNPREKKRTYRSRSKTATISAKKSKQRVACTTGIAAIFNVRDVLPTLTDDFTQVMRSQTCCLHVIDNDRSRILGLLRPWVGTNKRLTLTLHQEAALCASELYWVIISNN